MVQGNHSSNWLALILHIAKSTRQSLVNALYYFVYMKTSNKLIKTGLESAFDDLDPRFSLLCQVGDDVICPFKICGGGGGVPDACPKILSFIAINVGCPIQS